MAKYVKFHPDLWTTIFNYEAIGVVTSPSDIAMKVTGHFRTQADYIGLRFNSEDFWNHSYVKYATNKSYANVSLSFTPQYLGLVATFNDTELQPSLIIKYGDGSTEKYVTLGMFGVKNNNSDLFNFDGQINLSKTWIDVGSEQVSWTNGTESGTGILGTDYDMDYARGIFYTVQGNIPYNADVTLTYTYNTHENYNLDFNNLYEGVHPNLKTSVSTEDILSVTLPVIPNYFQVGDLVMTGRSDAFELTIGDMVVVGGELNDKPLPMPKNAYRLAEGFDDEYNKNPKRLIESMALLGYEGVINLYIGASHFYDKHGTSGQVSVGIESIKLDETVGLNTAFKAWLNSYLQHMSLNGFTDIVTSVSMECLQMPESWKQRLWNGQAGATGWSPPTSFYSPNNAAVKTYIDRITCETLDIVVAKGFTPILQLGESWYWWQEFQPGDVNTPYEGRPPCFYDEDTKTRFRNDMGYDLPVYESSDIIMTSKNIEVAKKLRSYLGEYTVFMKSIANKYVNSQFTILFFPPSVLDKARTPAFLQTVNAPFEYWKYPELDFIQIEDYDWVTSDNSLHKEVFGQAWEDMGYPFAKQHYFAGFVLKPENAVNEWKLIERAAQEALGRQYGEVFIWAGTQIRRDSWTPKINTFVADSEKWSIVNKPYVASI